MCEPTADSRPPSIAEIALREKQQDEWSRQEALRQAVSVVGAQCDPARVVDAAAQFHAFLTGTK